MYCRNKPKTVAKSYCKKSLGITFTMSKVKLIERGQTLDGLKGSKSINGADVAAVIYNVIES